MLDVESIANLFNEIIIDARPLRLLNKTFPQTKHDTRTFIIINYLNRDQNTGSEEL
jgi:hypothetical protein